jgi:hypothetical protein
MAFTFIPGDRSKELYQNPSTVPTFKEHTFLHQRSVKLIMFRKIIFERYCILGSDAVWSCRCVPRLRKPAAFISG